MAEPVVTPTARVITAIDAGAATTSVALLGRLANRWRLLGSIAAPAGVAESALIARLIGELEVAELGLGATLGLDPASTVPLRTLRAETPAPPTLVVLAGSPRALEGARRVATATGWRVVGAQPESHDPRDVTGLLLRPEVRAVLIAASDPPGADERSSLDDLAALVAAVRLRRPGLPVVLSGAMAARRRRFDRLGLDDHEDPAPVIAIPSARGLEPTERVRSALEAIRAPAGDGRSAIARSAVALAAALDRRVEVLDIGLNAGLRAVADPPTGGEPGRSASITSAEAGLAPFEPDDASIDGVLAWATRWGDRHRIGDRLHDLRLMPWADATGIGARLRLAAAAAAIERLVGHSDHLSAGPPPDLVVLAGGGFALAPPTAVAVTLADVLRRPGGVQVAFDHARLLGPIGMLPDVERQTMLADLADDLLLPIGSVVVVAHAARPVRGEPGVRVQVVGDGVGLQLEVGAGTIELVELAPGDHAIATIETETGGRLGPDARRVSVPVSGGVAGLIVDGRGIPLRLPARGDDRRAALAAWHDPLWAVPS